jgi:hypothetical protein
MNLRVMGKVLAAKIHLRLCQNFLEASRRARSEHVQQAEILVLHALDDLWEAQQLAA